MRIPDQLSLRVLVVGGSRDFGQDLNDGFVTRHRHLTRELIRRHDVRLLGLREHGDQSVTAPDLAPRLIGDIPVPVVQSRRHRLGVMSRRFRPIQASGWARQIVEAADQFRPEIVITFGPWLDYQFEHLRRRHPTVHFFEEDVSPLFPVGDLRLAGRGFAWAERVAHRWARGRPSVVVVISSREEPVARRRYPRSQVTTVSFALPGQDWPVASGPSCGHDLLVVGALDQERNAAGLVDVLEEFRLRAVTEVPVVIVCGANPHPSLLPYLEAGLVRREEHAESLWMRYRSSRMCLVPARTATGVKTTILQGWSQGTPVATFRASAATVPGAPDSALLVDDEPADLVEKLLGAWHQPSQLAALSKAGLDAYRARFDDAASAEQVDRVVRMAQARRPPRSG